MRFLLCSAVAVLLASTSAHAQAEASKVVPRAIGLSYEKAKTRFEESEILYDFDPEPPPGPNENYRVVKLTPEAGSVVSATDQVTAELQLVEPGQLVAPELLGMSLSFALGELYICDFSDARIAITPSDHDLTSVVTEVKEKPGAIIDLNNAINVVVFSKRRPAPEFLFETLALVAIGVVFGLVAGWWFASRFRGRGNLRGET
jgi:beta-lactam-binding protein with PASTA domain